ncbi:MAG TPA: 3,4-dehydroadipyl-CoA semialdehyde dehydrogenase [Kofleriaceae bacterium]|nr:3,4-dehydroadipyl-CoA semialdehyde dehydrogenase [Kofleriaceae bacterium]
MKRLESYVCGGWVAGQGPVTALINPSTDEVIGECGSGGIDMAAALAYARARGGPALRELTFAQRGQILRAMSKVLHGGREELIALAIENGGNTRSDAKFDIDGAIFTLSSYGELGHALGDRKLLVDGEGVQLGRTARFYGEHVLTPRRGVAVHVNAFNFPAWGLAEKAATALLAGMPVVSKPASATAMVAWRMMQIFVDAKVLPDGALSFLCGSAGKLLDSLAGQDVLAFTGSSVTARTLRSGEGVVARSVHVNVEADSLNAAVLAPDVAPGSETWNLFVADVSRDITQKTGQKCTAIRRVMVPESRLADVSEALSARLTSVVVGNPTEESVQMGPLATRAQLDDVKSGIARLARETEALVGGEGEVKPRGVAEGKGCFVAPVVRLARDPRAAASVHEHEVFGPVATICVYSGAAEEAAELVGLGDGGLVASIYSDERDWLRAAVPAMAPLNGRLYLGSEKMASQSPGPGTVMPQLVHGGPGRAGGGEELGGLRGMSLYQQRTALQGDKSLLAAILEPG